ncbi:MAG TPA: ABC-F family ATP-binding cassette domain-containing protein [Spongiibacteraceae bacterium]|nr:ABC-F family ATP-binding cassette domain-containing protein [Spongiibacteraceae bacterium]
MTSLISLTLESVSYQLPDGSILFADLTEQFDARPTGLVGRNGIGKSVLARLLAGELTPTAGRCVRAGPVYYLPQQISTYPGQTVADLAGVRGVIDALANITRGSTEPADFEKVGERWDIHQQLQQELASNRLDYLQADTPTAKLSGGEIMRVALLGAFLSRADMLILDEPTNHLDRNSRRILLEQLQHWQKGLIAISHDRALLENMSRIVELSTLGLRSYGGNYSFYAQTKNQQQEHALEQLEQRKAARKREQRALQEQREKLERRQARGNKQASQTNQAKILLGRQKERSEVSGGKLRAKHDAQQNELSERVRAAALRVEEDAPIVLYAPAAHQAMPHKIVELDNVVLPFAANSAHRIDLALTGNQRIGLIGPNGIGKSTLLRVLANLVAPLSGQCQVFVPAIYLDQQLATLRPEQSLLDQLLAVNSSWGESVVRTRLAQLGLNADRILLPTELLSGGERLKGALACALYADQPAQLLLLDEPSNHLDLNSLQALESMLRQYSGALIVVSHDEVFLGNISLTHRLEAGRDGWVLQAW